MKKINILVVGDLMLDGYIWGEANRLSPEAPVPILLAKKESFSLGGACNVANNLVAFNCQVSLCGVLGDDEDANKVLKLLESKNIDSSLILKDSTRPTTLKTRIISNKHQMMRLDKEDTSPITKDLELVFLEKITPKIKQVDAIILSDYLKGMLTKSLSLALISLANKNNKLIVCDPKGDDYSKYQNASLITPNKAEAKLATKIEIKDDASLKKALEALQGFVKYPLITLSEEGMAFLKDGVVQKIKAKAQEVYDVSGAGDTAICALAFRLINKDSLKQACEFANAAAAIVVAKIGSAVASLKEIEELLDKSKDIHGRIFEFSNKDSKDALLAKLENKKVVFTNGCFDILHIGHTSYLQEARKLGECLVVGLNSDASVRLLKGSTRPINTQLDRAKILCSLSSVDFVIIFNEETPEQLIKEIKPHILVKGADYKNKEVVGKNHAKEVVLIDFIESRSSTSIINKIKDANG